MIPLLKVSVLLLLAVLAFVLACRKERYQSTYRMILVLVALGATTLIPEASLIRQAGLALGVFLIMTLITHFAVRSKGETEDKEERVEAEKRKI